MCMVISVWWATRAGCPHNAANELRLRSSAPASLDSTHAPYTLCHWQDVSYPIASCADILNINTPSLSLSLSLASNFQLTASGPSSPPVRPVRLRLVCDLASLALKQRVAFDSWHFDACERRAYNYTGWGNQVSGTWWRQDDIATQDAYESRSVAGAASASVIPFFFWVLYCTLIRKWQQPQQRQGLVISSVSCWSRCRLIATKTTTVEQDSCK